MQRQWLYFVVSGSDCTMARSMEELAGLWAERIEDPGAEIRASRELTPWERDQLGMRVLNLLASPDQ
jgi:hypothetical protein